MNPELVFNSIVCAVSVWAAAHFPMRERRAAMICAAMLFPIWALYSLSFVKPYNPAHLFHVSSFNLWATYDTIGGGIVLYLAGRTKWGMALFATFFAETVAHCLRVNAYIGKDVYYPLLNTGFYAQGAIFLAMGGRGIGSQLSAVSKEYAAKVLRRHSHVLGFLVKKFRKLSPDLFNGFSTNNGDCFRVAAMPPAPHHVIDIVLNVSPPEVIGIDTRRIVAGMERPQVSYSWPSREG